MPPTPSPWSPAQQTPEPSPASVDVWAVALELDDAAALAKRRLLSDDESARADRFRHERHRRRFIAGRAALREILAMLLAADAAAITFDYGLRGKPSLASQWQDSGLEFNLTNSGELALIAVTRSRAVGVDVECLRRPRDFTGLAQRFFAAAEHEALLQMSDAEQVAGFFRLWTRKEALLKAVGTGLATPLNQVVVNAEANSPPQLIAYNGPGTNDWSLGHLEPAAGYLGALATAGPLGELRCWRYES